MTGCREATGGRGNGGEMVDGENSCNSGGDRVGIWRKKTREFSNIARRPITLVDVISGRLLISVPSP